MQISEVGMSRKRVREGSSNHSSESKDVSDDSTACDMSEWSSLEASSPARSARPSTRSGRRANTKNRYLQGVYQVIW